MIRPKKKEPAKKKFKEAREIASGIEVGEDLLSRIEDSFKLLEERQNNSRK